VDSAKNHYILAEKLWSDKNYEASVKEFERVISKENSGKLGIQALYRAAMTQALFLAQYPEAIKKFENFVQRTNDPQLAWEAKLQIGDLLFSKLERYQNTIEHYRTLLKEKPEAVETPEFRYRIAKSQFYLLRFQEAIDSFQQLRNFYPKSSWSEKASFELGDTYLTWGEQEQASGNKTDKTLLTSIKVFESFLKEYPNSSLVPQARFGIASSLETLDRLDEALQIYQSLKGNYIDPRVIEIKLHRITERINHKKRNKS